jgi:hypothetical protein
MDGIKIRPKQEGRTAGDRGPCPRLGFVFRKRLTVGADNAKLLPLCVTARGMTRACRHAHLIAPMFVAAVLASLGKELRGCRKRVVGRPERRNLSIVVIIDSKMEPDFRHPLGVAHGAGPRASHFGRRAPAVLNDGKRVD